MTKVLKPRGQALGDPWGDHHHHRKAEVKEND